MIILFLRFLLALHSPNQYYIALVITISGLILLIYMVENPDAERYSLYKDKLIATTSNQKNLLYYCLEDKSSHKNGTSLFHSAIIMVVELKMPSHTILWFDHR